MYNSEIQSILDGVSYLIDTAIMHAPFNKIKNGRIINKNNNSYEIMLDNKNYWVPALGASSYDINDIVKVMIPQNNYNDMFILMR